MYTPGPRDPTETGPDLPLSASASPVEARVISGQLQGQGFQLQRSWEASHVAQVLSEELKGELPRLAGAHILLEKSGETAPGRMRRLSQREDSAKLWR